MKHEKSTFSVLFYLKKDKAKKSGLVPLHARITVDGKMTQFNTKLEVNESCWQSGKATGKSLEANRINTLLGEIRTCLHTYYHDLQLRDGYVTAERVKNAFLGKEEKKKTIISFFEQHNEQCRQKVSNNLTTRATYTRYELTKNRLIDFMQGKYKVADMPIREITPAFIEQFYLYVRENFGCTHNTAMKFIQRFRTIVSFAKRTGLVTADPFVNYKLKFERTDRGYLTQEEIEQIMNKKFSTKRLDQVRDIFVFSCFCGLAYIDVKNLRGNNIRTSFDEGLWIVGKREKTGVKFNIPLLEIPKMILEKYKGALPDGYVLPVLSNQKMNAYLKEIGDLCGIEKELTFHLARHSFATLALSKGVSIESVSKMLGHTNIQTTQIYARVINAKIGNEMALFAGKVKGMETKYAINQ